MAYFEWAEDLVIDGGPIDQDHRKLVDQVNELHTATSDGRGRAMVGRLLDDLISSTVAHIRREEELMASISFPNLEGHKQGHEKFVADLRALQQRYRDGHITVAAQLSSTLRDWLSIHIRRNDKELVRHMKKRRREAAR